MGCEYQEDSHWLCLAKHKLAGTSLSLVSAQLKRRYAKQEHGGAQVLIEALRKVLISFFAA